MSESFHYWVCDNCHKWQPTDASSQNPIRVQQRSERIFGTEQMFRPVEKLVICDRCIALIREEARGRRL